LLSLYPLPFIFSTINTRIKQIEQQEKTRNTEDNHRVPTNINNKKDFFTIPYISTISESFLSIAQKIGFDIAYSIPNTLQSFIKRGKDKIDTLSKYDVVYKINCYDCKASCWSNEETNCNKSKGT